LPGASVEIWQACANGRYNDSRDPNPAPRDPDFQGWGRVVTDDQGAFRFTTIKPGAYPTDPNDPTGWIRPPHIHFKVRAPGAPVLITQMYFAGEALNDRDEILLDVRRSVGDDAADAVIVAFTGSGTTVDPFVGHFELTVGARIDPRVTPFLD
jgi:protocatechuate 3,4-dioxygenase beta subunit